MSSSGDPLDNAEIQSHVNKLFELYERLGDTDLLMLRALWDDGDQTARQRAWITAEKEVSASGRDSLLNDARNRIAVWVNNYDPAYGVAQGSISGSEGFAAGSVRQAAIPPLLDAVLGTIVGDRLTEDDYETLGDAFLRLRSGIEPHESD